MTTLSENRPPDIPDGLTVMTELPTADWNPSKFNPRIRAVYVSDKEVVSYAAAYSEQERFVDPHGSHMVVLRAVLKELTLAIDSKQMWLFFQQLHNWDPS